jgi:hypothetical protein
MELYFHFPMLWSVMVKNRKNKLKFFQIMPATLQKYFMGTIPVFSLSSDKNTC